MDVLALSMKTLTFLGVLAAALALNLPTLEARPFGRLLALGLAGVALMVANAWLAATPLALLADLAYLGVCAAALSRALRAWRRAPVNFHVVGEAA